jgi:broad specificity phosphatase PhoE
MSDAGDREAMTDWYEVAMVYREALERIEKRYPGTLAALADGSMFIRGMAADLDAVERAWTSEALPDNGRTPGR